MHHINLLYICTQLSSHHELPDPQLSFQHMRASLPHKTRSSSTLEGGRRTCTAEFVLRNLVRNQEAHYRDTGRTRYQYQSSGPPGQWQQASTPPALGHERKLLEARHAAMQHAALVSPDFPPVPRISDL